MAATTKEVPLFPLKLVLFPGTVHPLHIFEARYRKMLEDCLSEEKSFGIVLAREESRHLREIPSKVGTMVAMHNVKTLDEGGYNLMAVGSSRFRILDYHREKPYLSGIVELFDDTLEPADNLVEPAQEARDLFITYLNMMLSSPSEQEISTCLPTSAESLSHFIAYFLDIEDSQKQQYLELTSVSQRLQEELMFLRREVPFMREIIHKDLPPDRLMMN